MTYEGQVARGVGWFSIGLGLAQVATPKQFGRMIGVGDGTEAQAALRFVGAREIAAGTGILLQKRPAGWLWGRVGGDAIDLALLGTALRSDSAQRGRIVAAVAAVAGITALDVLLSRQFSDRPSLTTSSNQGVDVVKTIIVDRPAEELYRFWHNFENLPRFMSHLESVQITGDRRSHWRATAPAGTTAEWDAETIEDSPNELIAWRSLPGADVTSSGSVRFRAAPGSRGTEVRVELRYDPPGGALGVAFAKLFGEEPAKQVYDELRAFKQVMEIGEVVQSDSTAADGHPAQPPALAR